MILILQKRKNYKKNNNDGKKGIILNKFLFF